MRFVLFMLTILLAPLSLIAEAQTRILPDGSVYRVATRQADQVRGHLEAFLDGQFEDIAAFKLAIDTTIDPNTEKADILAAIDRATETVRRMAGANATEPELVNALRTFVYEKGVWNENRPFGYDHSDPLGTNIHNKLLGTYLLTRKGNCVSMPTLILVLGRRLGLDVTMATAPSHVFIKYRPENADQYLNLETTSGANPAREDWIRQGFPMTDRSIESGLYMRALSEPQLAALIAVTAMEHAYGENRYWDAILIAEKILEIDDRNISAILTRASSLGRLMDEDFHTLFPDPSKVPPHLHSTYRSYHEQNVWGFDRAAILGFRSGT